MFFIIKVIERNGCMDICKLERLVKFIESREEKVTSAFRFRDGAFSLTGEKLTKSGVDSISDMTCKGDKILDVGVGKGLALDMFKSMGLEVTGISLNQDEIDDAVTEGHDVRRMDMSFMDFDDETFDVLWSRHSLEHSLFPFFTLHEFKRVLKPNGVLYVEVPAPNTKNNNEHNTQHFSVFLDQQWVSLIRRSGFKLISGIAMKIGTIDIYYRFIAKKNGSIS